MKTNLQNLRRKQTFYHGSSWNKNFSFFFSLLGKTCTFLREAHSAGKWGEGHVPLSRNQDLLQELVRLALGRGQEEHDPREWVRDCAKSCPLWVGTKEGSSVQLLTWADKLSLGMVPAVGQPSLGEFINDHGSDITSSQGKHCWQRSYVCEYELALFCISWVRRAHFCRLMPSPLLRAGAMSAAGLWLSGANILQCSGFMVPGDKEIELRRFKHNSFATKRHPLIHSLLAECPVLSITLHAGKQSGSQLACNRLN